MTTDDGSISFTWRGVRVTPPVDVTSESTAVFGVIFRFRDDTGFRRVISITAFKADATRVGEM
jgi:hypothetical protein